jgi:hypothetical protein
MEDAWDALFKVFGKIEKAVANKISKSMKKIGRYLPNLRKNTSLPLLSAIHAFLYGAPSEFSEPLMIERAGVSHASIEVKTYLQVLICMHLVRDGRNEDCISACNSYLEMNEQESSHTLDPILAKLYYYYALATERTGTTVDW